MRVFRVILFCLGGLCLCFGSVSPVYGGSPLAETQSRAMQKSILGRWVATVGTERIELRVGRDKQFVLGEISGTFILEESTLQFRSEDSEASYQYKISGNQLTLSGDDLSEPLVFLRQPQVTDYIGTWLNVSPRLVAGKLYRVFVIVAIVAWAGLLVWLLKKFDRWLVVTDSGPLKYLYRTHKNRALTVHSLVLNVIKYVIYFTALGYVLSELGINYTAYLASLSVVGLAIGFGSQGLVQDMVTGFSLSSRTSTTWAIWWRFQAKSVSSRNLGCV